MSIGDRIGAVADFLKNAIGWRRRSAAFFAGLACAFALAPFYLLPLYAAGFTVLILLLDGVADDERPLRRAFGVGWWFGFGYFLLGVYWMAFSFFVQAEQFAWMSPAAFFGMPAFLALFYGGAAAVSIRLWRSGWPRILIAASVFAVFEYARGHILTGLPWNLPGQILAGAPVLAQTAAWWGVYGLSLVVLILAALPAASIGNAGRRGRGVAAMIAMVGALAGLGWLRLAAPSPASGGEAFVRIVQPNINQRDKIDPEKWAQNFNRQLELSKGVAPPAGRLFVIWPENGAPRLDEADAALQMIDQALPENAVLIAGAVRIEWDGFDAVAAYNSIAVVPHTAKGRKVVAAYDKHHLVPFGEYLPFYELLNAVGLSQLTPYGDAGFDAGAGPRVMSAGGPPFAPLICYEAIFPGALYPRGERPEWLLTVTNDAWFGDTSGPRQHLDMARLRSIETGLPMARSANTGISALIDAKGRIIERIPLYRAGRIEAALPPALNPTLYHRFGDMPFFLMTVLCFLGAIRAPRALR